MISVIQELKIWSPKEVKKMKNISRIMKTGGIDKDPRNKRLANILASKELRQKGLTRGAGVLSARANKMSNIELKKKYKSASLK